MINIAGKKGRKTKVIAAAAVLSLLLSFTCYFAIYRSDAAAEKQGASLEIKQTADAPRYQPGDLGEYCITVKQTSDRAAAKDVKLCDAFNERGIVIEPLLVVIYLDGRDISRQCDFVIKDRAIMIDTNQDLKKGETLTASIPAELKSVSKDTERLNIQAKAAADNVEAVSVSGTTEIIRPKLELEEEKKDKDGEKSSSLGDAGEYCYKIKQKQKGAAAKMIQIKNKFHLPGVKYIGNSIEVAVGGNEITDGCKISIVDNGYLTIEPQIPLEYGEIMTVRYRVEYAGENLKNRRLKNTCTVFSDNQPQDKRISAVIVRKNPQDVRQDELWQISENRRHRTG